MLGLAAVCPRHRRELLTSTAMTTLAPSDRQVETGSGLTRPPSINHCPSISTGAKMPGRPMEARTARSMGPLRKMTSAPDSISAATAANGMEHLSIGPVTPRSASNASMRAPSIKPPLAKRTSNNAAMLPKVTLYAHSRRAARRPVT
jgi:hypothetical protein